MVEQLLQCWCCKTIDTKFDFQWELYGIIYFSREKKEGTNFSKRGNSFC